MMNKQISLSLETEAQRFRERNGLSATEPIRLKSILQKQKILTVYRPLSTDCSGMSIKMETANGYNLYMLVNSAHSIGRQHFTICHELYHLFIQQSYTSSKSSAGKFDKQGDPEEYKADVFASYLLLPVLGVQEMIPAKELKKNAILLTTILAIEQTYSCSRSALLFRLKQMGLIDNSRYDFYSTDIKKNALQRGYSTKLYERGNDGEVVGDYGTLAYKAWEKGLIQESVYLSFMKDLGVDTTKLTSNDSDGEDL
jgi:Zn-dependent peptidase ImmA (M78 family)